MALAVESAWLDGYIGGVFDAIEAMKGGNRIINGHVERWEQSQSKKSADKLRGRNAG